MRKRHDKKTIAKACRLHAAGMPLRQIMARTGIKSTSTIMFACDPEYRDEQLKRSYAWRKKHPKRWREISRKAVNRYAKRQKKA